MTLITILSKKIDFKKIVSPSNEEYKKKQDEINLRIKDIIKQYSYSIEEASKYYVR